MSLNRTNIKRSLEKYIYDNIYTIEGINVSWSGLPFDNKSVDSWIQPRIDRLERIYRRQSSGTQYGNSLEVTLGVDIFCKKSGVTLSDKHYMISDQVAKYFKIGEDIDLKSYTTDNSQITTMRVREILSDGSDQETNEFLKYRISWLIDYTEEITQP